VNLTEASLVDKNVIVSGMSRLKTPGHLRRSLLSPKNEASEWVLPNSGKC